MAERSTKTPIAAVDAKARRMRIVRRGLLGFWAIWTTIVLATNLTDALKALGVLPNSWSFSSGNYALLRNTMAVYQTPSWLAASLFGGIIIWQALVATLYFRAAFSSSRGDLETLGFIQAFAASLGLWMAFMLADEVFLAYRVESTHRSVFTAQLLTLAVLWLLREPALRE